MATHVPCKKNDTNGYVFYVSLVSQANTKIFQANPTYAAGDIKVAVDDAAPANVSAVAVDGDFTKRVKITLSQAQTNGDNLTIICSDAAGSEWCDLTINIQTSAQTLDEIDTNVDDIETDTNEVQGKLPTNKFMGSSDGADDDGTLNSITAAGPTKAEMDTAHALLATPAQVASELGTYDAPTKGELDTAIALITDDLDNVTDGLGALKALLDTISGYVDLIDDGTSGLAAIKAEVEGIGGVAMRGTDNVVLTGPTVAQMNTAHGLLATPAQVATALTDIHLDHLLAATYDPASKPGTADALLNEIIESDGGVSRFTENALEEGPSGTGDDATATNQTTIITALGVIQADLDAPDQYKSTEHTQL